jgi:hypothetical protein
VQHSGMTGKPTESDDAVGANSAIHGSTEPPSSAEPAPATRSLAVDMGGVSSSTQVSGQKGVEDGAKTPRNSGKRRDKSKSVEPSELQVDRQVAPLSLLLFCELRVRSGVVVSLPPCGRRPETSHAYLFTISGASHLVVLAGTDSSIPSDCSPTAW